MRGVEEWEDGDRTKIGSVRGSAVDKRKPDTREGTSVDGQMDNRKNGWTKSVIDRPEDRKAGSKGQCDKQKHAIGGATERERDEKGNTVGNEGVEEGGLV